MADSLSDQFLTLLNVSPLSRIRRNHGLEHATLHILSRRHPRMPLAGHSDWGGFWILGDVPTEELSSAAQEALMRLRNGEHNLAVHPTCGTNYAAAGILAGVAASAAMFGTQRRFRDVIERLPLAATLATLAVIVAQPLGLLLQEHVTTSGSPETLEIVEIIPKKRRGRVEVHRVVTEG